MDQELFSKVDEYINNLFVHEDEPLTAAIKSIDESGMPQISISANQGKFLQLLAKLCGAKKILEIGTLGGYSTIWLARALPENGKLMTLEIDPKRAEIAGNNIKNAGLHGKVEIKIGDAIETLKSINDIFDMIFIDAYKPAYVEYFEQALLHSHSGTLIVADNVIREGKVMDENCGDENSAGARQFNSMLASCKDVSATIISTVGIKGFDGMAIAIVN